MHDLPLSHATPRGARDLTTCDLALPEAFALRLEARAVRSPRAPACCPLEATALRQWCVRLQRAACPLEAVNAAEAPIFLTKR
ncbi:hypothetical protein [Paraburkholderia sp. J41]|uniref:hypothetical protein n=1 Tax=Paraburkholderia sp. J41 TaxID=2805433 RepID=UPI002AC36C78|nr:hypothetical protein [Paraburkholderia sp. J41]